MSILLAGLLLSAWGLLVLAAPKRKRYRRWRCIGDESIDGDDNDSSAAYDPLGDYSGDAGGDFGGHHGGGDFGGGHGGGDFGGGDCSGSDGGSCGSD